MWGEPLMLFAPIMLAVCVVLVVVMTMGDKTFDHHDERPR